MGCWVNIQESQPHLVLTQAEMEILCPKIGPDEDEHIAQIVRLHVAVIFLVSHSLCFNHLSVILMFLTEGYRAQDEGEE